jgi:hypothetical protein
MSRRAGRRPGGLLLGVLLVAAYLLRTSRPRPRLAVA